MARGELEKRVLHLVQHVFGGSTLPTPEWLMRPGKTESRDHWSLVCDIYNALTGLCLPDTMPPRESRIVDCVLKVNDGAPRIIEVDEKQHFNLYRARTLSWYPDIPIAFDAAVWIENSKAKLRLERGGFGKPMPPLFPGEWGRHQQRAFRDALADILPSCYGFLPTLRIADFEVKAWLASRDAPERMKELLERKFRCAPETEKSFR